MQQDQAFKEFLKKLQDQNNRDFVVQLGQLKTEREIKEDDEKNDELLEEIDARLEDVRKAVTGVSIDVDLTPLVNIGENQTRLLDEISKESALMRKLSEGSIEYDKEASQYRNKSGREIESVVSGKMSKKGGFIDFETARNATSGQGERARTANEVKLKTIDYVPGNSTISTFNTSSTSNKNSTSNTSSTSNKNSTINQNSEKNNTSNIFSNIFKYLGDEIVSGAMYFLTQGQSGGSVNKKTGKKRDFQTQVSLNPDSDNIVTSQEAIADATKSDLQVTKDILDATREQLIELKAIREALAPSTPKELAEQKSKPGAATIEPNQGFGIPPIPPFPNKPNAPTNNVPPAASAALAAGTLATVAIGGAAATYAATGMLAAQEEHRKAYSAEQDKSGLLSALSGDTGIAATILDANEGKSAKEIQATQEKERKALENAPWYTKYYGIGKSEYLKDNPMPVEGVSAEQAQEARSNYAAVDPRRVDTTGRTVANTSTENVDMNREASKGGSGGNTIVSNSVNSTNTTKYVPMKASPRPEYSGSALDRYQSRITVY